MNDPAEPRNVKVSEFVAESLEEIASHSSQGDELRGAAISQRTVPTNKTVNVHDVPTAPHGGQMQVFFFKVVGTRPGMYAVRVKAPDLETAQDYIAGIPEILLFEHVEESEYHNATFEKLTEAIDALWRQSGSTR